ncbi:unnamed protein product [Amoebophrya sp. A25]|nr:unnamed protein product [Amoebophrya sp. A25]|eukprot:GSA25T00012423001.1
MVDYSKWNRMDISDSEKESSDEGPPSPKVTRFDSQQKVTFGGGKAIQIQPSLAATKRTTFQEDADPSAGSAWRPPALTGGAPGTVATKVGPAKSQLDWSRALERDWTRNGGFISSSTAGKSAPGCEPDLSAGSTSATTPTTSGGHQHKKASTEQASTISSSVCARAGSASANGASSSCCDAASAACTSSTSTSANTGASNTAFLNRLAVQQDYPTYYWSQSQGEVILRFECPATPWRPKFKKLDERTLQIENFFIGRFTYEVVAPEDMDDVDWEFETGTGEENRGTVGQRYLKLTVRKKAMIVGSVFWWRAAFKGHPELQPGDFQDRSRKNIEKQKEFYNRMEEATRLFKEKVRKQNGASILPDASGDLTEVCRPAGSGGCLD